MTAADIVIYSKKVIHGLEVIDTPRFVAIKDGTITGIGEAKDAESYVGPGTVKYRNDDCVIMPGFHDNHVHLYLSMIFNNSCFLGDTTSEEEAVDILRRHYENSYEGEWILGYGWHQSKWKDSSFPSKRSLDRYFKNKPVFLLHETAHSAWVNSFALKLSNIDRNTPDCENGLIEKDPDGEPTGFLSENAYSGVAKRAFQLNDDQERRAFKNFLKICSEYGVTSVDDMFYIMGLDLGNPELYRKFEENGGLSTRINFYKPIDSDIDALKDFEKYRTEKVNFMGVKGFIDGVASSHTAYMVDEYSDRKNFFGQPFYSVDRLDKLIADADRAEYKIRLHAVGDGSVRMVINAYEKLRLKNGDRDRRNCIEHIEVIHPDDISRLRSNNIIPSLQPNHMAITKHLEDNPFFKYLGREREPFYWMNKTLIDNSVATTYGTDYPIAPFSPFNTIYRAISRKMDDGKPDTGWNPKEKVDIPTAIMCYTYNGAYSNYQEHVKGSITVGKKADLVLVKDKQLFGDIENIRDAHVKLTVSDGKVVYED